MVKLLLPRMVAGMLVFLMTPSGSLLAQFSQQGGKLIGSGYVGTTVYEGMSVAISSDGSTAIVGATADNSFKGAAWVFTRNGNFWSQQGNKLVGTGYVGTKIYQGVVCISADGNTAAVGGWGDNSNVGGVWVFTRSGNTWSQQGGKLVGSGMIGAAAFGTSVALSGDGNTLIVGGPADNSYKGAVWVYTRSGTTWSQQGSKLVGTNGTATAYEGGSVALSYDGNTALVGGSGDNGGIGSAWVFTRSGSTWSQQGGKLSGVGHNGNGNFGYSAALSADGNTAVVGAPLDSGAAGAAWVFTRSSGTWSGQGGKIVGSDAMGIAEQATSVSISADGNMVLVGGYRDNSYFGATWVFIRSNGYWTQQGAKLIGTGGIGPQMGKSVSLSADGATIISGGPIDSVGRGAAWIFYSGVTTVSAAHESPMTFQLAQNYPNPFNPTTDIAYTVEGSRGQASGFSDVRLVVYDLLGRVVATLVNEQKPAGTYTVRFDGSGLSSGVYFYRLSAGNERVTRKMILTK